MCDVRVVLFVEACFKVDGGVVVLSGAMRCTLQLFLGFRLVHVLLQPLSLLLFWRYLAFIGDDHHAKYAQNSRKGFRKLDHIKKLRSLWF